MRSAWWMNLVGKDNPASKGNRFPTTYDPSDPNSFTILDYADAYLNDYIDTKPSTKAYTEFRDSLPPDERNEWPSPRTMVARLGKLAKPCSKHKRTPRQKGEQCDKCETAWQAAVRLVP